MVLNIGSTNCAGFTVGRATVVEKVKLFKQECFETPFGCLVGSGTSHHAGADDNHVELRILHG